MAYTFIRLGLLCGILCCIIAGSGATNEAEMKKRKMMEDRMKLLKEYEEFERHVTDTVTSIFNNLHQEDDCAEEDKDVNGVCRKALPESPQDFNGTEIELLERLDNIQKILVTLIPLLSVLENHQRFARVPHPVIRSKLNDSVHFSCDSHGQSLSVCLWERNVGGKVETIVIDREVQEEGGRISAAISASGGGLQEGECGIIIHSLKEDDLGTWRCLLVTTTDSVRIFSGEVNVRLEGSVPRVYAATAGGVIEILPTGKVVRKATNYAFGIAIDTMRKKLYWTDLHVIYRSQMDGSAKELLLKTSQYGSLYGLGFDFITGNIYVASHNGFILACDGTLNQNFTCVNLIHEENMRPFGITLNPYSGTMYWSVLGFSINKASMDGSNITVLVPEVGIPIGLAIDFDASRLYWADPSEKKIQSCNLDGKNVVNVTQVSSKPWGIAVVDRMVYWSSRESKRVESMGIDGGDVRTIYNGTDTIYHLTSPHVVLPRNRSNPCERKTCDSGVCVLTSTFCTCRQ